MPTTPAEWGGSKDCSHVGSPKLCQSNALGVASTRCGSPGSGSTLFATTLTSSGMWTIFITIQSNILFCRERSTRHSLPFLIASVPVFSRATGLETPGQRAGASASAQFDPDFASLHPGYEVKL